jgi:hypothetical protein
MLTGGMTKAAEIISKIVRTFLKLFAEGHGHDFIVEHQRQEKPTEGNREKGR